MMILTNTKQKPEGDMNHFSSLFCQMLALFSRSDFARAVKETGAEKACKGFSCWDQFVSMLFCQLGRAHSLREICGGLASSMGKLSHLGLKEAPSRSTLSYANKHRPFLLYQKVFFQLLSRCESTARLCGHKFRFKNKLMSLDSTIIDLCLSMYDWARFRRAKGAVKLHLLLDHDGYLPRFAVVTDGKTHDVKMTEKMRFEPGTILVLDRAYLNFDFLFRLAVEGVFFVTRIKSNTKFHVVEQLAIVEGGNIVLDCIITLGVRSSFEKYPRGLRLVVAWDPEKEQHFGFLTNNFNLAASTIAAIYKDRWQIELFFKALKQNLKIKTFLGTSPNAVKTQIWTALIAILMLKYLQLKSKFGWSLSNLAAMVRMNLLTYRDLWAWIDSPFETPVAQPPPLQLRLGLS
jgi:hypothetical protein